MANAEEAYRLREQQYRIGTTTQEQVISSFSTLITRRVDLANVLARRDLAVRRILLNEGTVNIQSLDKFATGNPAEAVPTDTGAAAAAANGGAASAPSGVPAASLPASMPPALGTGSAGSAGGSSAVPGASSQRHRT